MANAPVDMRRLLGNSLMDRLSQIDVDEDLNDGLSDDTEGSARHQSLPNAPLQLDQAA
jgi:hypothetical protein